MKLMLNGKEVSGMGHYVMAGDIKDATAEDSNVLSGKAYYNNNGKREGTMPNRGGMSAELSAGGSVSIPEGYHNGEGVVRAQDLASQTQATAGAGDIASGKTAWVNGEKVEGTYSPPSITVLKASGSSKTLNLDKAKVYEIVSVFGGSSSYRIKILRYNKGTTSTLRDNGTNDYGNTSITGNTLKTGTGSSSYSCDVYVFEVT